MIFEKKEIQNLVISSKNFFNFKDKKEIQGIYEKLYLTEKVIYQPKKFPGMTLKLNFKDVQASVLMFSSGRVVITGIKKIEFIQDTLDVFTKILKNNNIYFNPDFTHQIDNIVVGLQYHKKINLIKLYRENYKKLNMDYDTEQFPGLLYRLREYKAVSLIFFTGKIVLTGIKNVEYIDVIMNNIAELLSNTDLDLKN